MAVSAFSVYSTPDMAALPQALLFSAVFFGFAFPSCGVWTAFGSVIGRLLESRSALRLLNGAMAALLAASVPLLFVCDAIPSNRRLADPAAPSFFHSVARRYISARHLKEMQMSRLLLTGIFAFLLLNFSGAGRRVDSAEPRVVKTTGEQDTRVRHECVKFNPDSVHVAGDAQGYGLASDGGWITTVSGSRAEARLAVYIIRFYGMDEFCRIARGRGALTYYLVNGWAPQGRSPSEDCLWFDPYGSQLKEVDGQWTLVDRNDTALSLGRNKAAALEAVGTIRNRNFSEICFVGRPGTSMVYFIR